MADLLMACKRCGSPDMRERFHLSVTIVYECVQCEMHFLRNLDDVQPPNGPPQPLKDDRRQFIAKQLQANPTRFPGKVAELGRWMAWPESRCMDIGAGGGLFLYLLAEQGAVVDGIEPSTGRCQFAAETYGIALRPEPVERAISSDDHEAFDLVTAWDVIEHVNNPFELLSQMASLTRPGGLLAFDTPSRDSILYRLGTMEHDISGGRSARLLGVMYSPQPAGHKQILRRRELTEFVTARGFEEVICRPITELSFPTAFYIGRVVHSARIASRIDALAERVVPLAPLRNKTLGIFRKRHSGTQPLKPHGGCSQ